ncbi:hypothetical protein [Sphingobacterium mizutaii]|uniref:hypothetical protein n=1 Tax=Sphingobacterium mizutaii TaxID=1010 RepID=UPI00289AB10E|nr:hypothetical protein [Sphingobacterium mizutaii]
MPKSWSIRWVSGAELRIPTILVHTLILVHPVGERSRTPHPINPGSYPDLGPSGG